MDIIAALVFYAVLFALSPIILRIIGTLIRDLYNLLIEATAVALAALISYSIPLLWRALIITAKNLALAMRFARAMINEARSSGEEDDQEDQDESDDLEEEFIVDAYVRARWLLGLEDSFTEAELKAAYRRAIFDAHPDRGGSAEAAHAVNEARDLIRRRRGWA